MNNQMNNLQIQVAQSNGFLKINERTVIYILGRARQFTGGDELLHQLGYHLRVDLGYQVYMFYYPPNIDNPVPAELAKYNNPFVREIIDDSNNILIVAEGVRDLQILKKYNNIRKVIYWLSVNNFLFSYIMSTPKTIYGLKVFLIRIINKIFLKNTIDFREYLQPYLKNRKIILRAFQDLHINDATLHLCQSQYAIDFLERFSIKNYAYLPDYLSVEFFQEKFDPDLKRDLVVYNPKKGWSFTRKIIQAAPDIKFVPIVNMSRAELINLLKIAKVYIDFGDHPGKDRIPREAAMLGCCVIVGKRGSASNEIDVPIPTKYKFDVSKHNIHQIVEAIRYSLANYKDIYHDFDEYRETIKKEPDIFIRQLKKIFTKTDESCRVKKKY